MDSSNKKKISLDTIRFMFVTKSSISETSKLDFCGYSSFSTNFNFTMENKGCKS